MMDDTEQMTEPMLANAHKKTITTLIIVGAIGLIIIAVWLILMFTSGPAASAQLQQAQQAYNADNFSSALQTVNQVLAKDPHNVSALVTKANILAQEGSLQYKEQQYGAQAQQLAEQAIALAPQSSEAYRVLGYSYEIRQMYPQAHTAYEKAISINPKNALAVYDNAHAYDLQGSTTPAYNGYMQATKLDPTLAQAHAGLGRLAYESGQYANALKQFQFAYENTQNVHQKAENAYSISSMEAVQGNLTAQMQYASTSVALDPNYSLGYVGLAVAQYAAATATGTPSTTQKKLLNQSFHNLLMAIGYDKNNSLAYLWMGEELKIDGEMTAALRIWQDGIKDVPNDINMSAQQKYTTLQQLEYLYSSNATSSTQKAA